MTRVEWPEQGKKFLFYLFFCPCLCPLMHTIIQVAKAPFSPEKVKMLMIVFLLAVQDLCVCGQWVFNLRYWHDIQIPLKGLECLYFL